MDDAGIVAGLKWIVGTAMLIFSGLGLNKLAENRQKRKYELQNRTQGRYDEAEAIHITNDGKRIDAEVTLVQTLLNKLTETENRLNARIDKLQDDLASQREMNAKKDQRIEHLEDENKRLRERGKEQDVKIQEQTLLIAGLRSEIDALKLLVDKNAQRIGTAADGSDPLKVELVEGKKEN